MNSSLYPDRQEKIPIFRSLRGGGREGQTDEARHALSLRATQAFEALQILTTGKVVFVLLSSACAAVTDQYRPYR